jgi:hypothetical protein
MIDGGTDATSDAGSDAGTADVPETSIPPAPPAGLSASVFDRRQTSAKLTWTAPATSWDGRVSTYQLRYAQQPITDATFDDISITTAATYSGTPALPGQPDSAIVPGLYIENDYYFAVAAVDADGNRSPITATTSPVTAHFNVTFISSPTGTNQEFGQPVDGSGDGNADGIADLVVGTAVETHAYIFFGKVDFGPAAPDVTIAGTNTGFGSMVRWIGDIDKDGIVDLAVSDPVASKVLIFKGRQSWPAALTDAQADYVVTGDATYNLTTFGSAVAPLGDFDGDGVDDFAIGAPGFGANAGHVDVVYGSTSFSSFALPSTTRALGIGPDAGLNRTLFGSAVLGLGHFYSVGSGTTLVVSAPGLGNATSTSSNEGRIYAFHGRGPGAAIDATAADHVRVGPGKGAKIGYVLSNLGPIVNMLPSCGAGNTADSLSAPLSGSSGDAFVLSGTTATGPFADALVVTQTTSVSIGQVVFGGGFSGRDDWVSLIGSSAKPDFVVTGQTTGYVDIIDGALLPGLASPTNAHSSGSVHVPLPSGWVGTARATGNLIKDINGDTYPDFALGDVFGPVPGRVAVFW